MTALTRGPLPARVYWVRRVLVVAVLTAMVVGGTRLVELATGGSPEPPDRAAQMSAEPGGTRTDDPVVDEPRDPARATKKQRKDKQRKDKVGKRKDKGPVLAEPQGACDDGDIAVTPTVDEAVGGSPITFVLELRTVESPACTWQVSPRTLTVKVTSGKDDIWSSLQCPRAIPRRQVVVRDNVSTEVDVTWAARRSEEGCNTAQGEWAMPGWYFVKAAALAGEPSDLHFEVTQPEPEVVTETVPPKHEKGERQGGRDGRRDGASD